jgi:hypothetical protein
MMNSLYGKFGQKGFEWVDLTQQNITEYYRKMNVPLPEEYKTSTFQPSVNWGTNKWFAAGLNDPISVRAFNGKIQMKFPAGEHYESSPIIAGYVTSYARERLRQLIAIAGHTQVFYCDTDSLFCTKKGYKALIDKGEVEPKKLGKLKLEGTADYAKFYCPKDYIIGHKEILKGIRGDAIPIGEDEYIQNTFEGIKSIMRRNPDPYIAIKWIIKKNSRKYTKSQDTGPGWINSLYLWETGD